MILSMNYPDKASLKLVGDKFKLTERQRKAVLRAACSDKDLQRRKAKEVKSTELKDATLSIDGFNLLITLETYLSGGFIFVGRDGCRRDLASIHGSYKRVSSTQEAVEAVGNHLAEVGIRQVNWYFDKPVSNSGKLKVMLYEIAKKKAWNWQIELDFNPDKVLIEAKETIVVSSDAIVINESARWYNLAKVLIPLPDFSQPRPPNVLELYPPL